MQQKSILKLLTKQEKSPAKYTLIQYFHLTSFKKISKEFKIKQNPYPLGVNANFFFKSKNTEKWWEELQKKAGEKFYKKNGLKKVITEHEKVYNQFNTYSKTLNVFIKKMKKAEEASLIEGMLTKVLEIELEKNNYFNQPPFELLKFINPPVTKATEDKIKASKLKSSKQIGEKYGWLEAKTLLSKGSTEAGKLIQEKLKQENIQKLKENIKANKGFIKEYEKSITKKLRIFSENARELNYLTLSAHKYIIMGRFKNKKLLYNKGINAEDFLYLLPWEFKKQDKEKVKQRKNKKHILLINSKEELEEFN